MLVLQFPILQHYPILHGTFLRIGGVSKKPFDSLNFGLFTEDNKEDVLHNHSHALTAFLPFPQQYVYLKHVHSNRILKTDRNTYQSLKNNKGDGLITKDINLALMSFHADCQATIIYDPMQHVVANIHAGWRGQIEKNIYAQAINTFIHQYNSLPKNLIVCISPSLGPDHSEMSQTSPLFYKNFSRHMTRPHYFNLWAIAKEQFLSLGLSEKNIHISEMCTFDHSQYCYSFRREKITGRHATLVALLEN